jgi:hypothetical protein
MNRTASPGSAWLEPDISQLCRACLFVLRPILLDVILRATDDVLVGVMLGKLLADVAFYVPAVVSHELRRKYRNVRDATHLVADKGRESRGAPPA